MLLGIAIGSATVCTGVTIYGDMKQLKHMCSSEYIAPEHWSAPLPGFPAATSSGRRYEQAVGSVKMDIVQECANWVVGVGLVLGGYDKLWRVCEKMGTVGGRGTGTIRSRVISTTAFATALLLGLSGSDLLVGSIYRRYTGVSIPSQLESGKDTLLAAWANLRHMEDEHARQKIMDMDPWKVYAVTGVGLMALFVGGTAGVTALYERVARRKTGLVTKMIAGVAAVGLLALTVPRRSGPVDPHQIGTLHGSLEGKGLIHLNTWKPSNTLKVKPDVLWKDVRTILAPHKVSDILVIPDKEGKGERLTWFTRPDQKPVIVKISNGLAVCLREWQLRELDHDKHLALLAESLIDERENPSKSWTMFCLATTLLAFPVMHQLYKARPGLLLAFFPRLSGEALQHIPLAASMSTTVSLTEISPLLGMWLNSGEADPVYDRDRQIVQTHPACKTGYPKVLSNRAQVLLASSGKESMDWDAGTTDPTYAVVHDVTPDTTSRIAAIDRL